MASQAPETIKDIAAALQRQIEAFAPSVEAVDIGTVMEVGDGIARIHGLASAKYNELLQFPNVWPEQGTQ
jgi:F-type H+-transporting ATPase subunit alpha